MGRPTWATHGLCTEQSRTEPWLHDSKVSGARKSEVPLLRPDAGAAQPLAPAGEEKRRKPGDQKGPKEKTGA